MNSIAKIYDVFSRLILLMLAIASIAGATELPADARLLLEKRTEAVKLIDRRFVEELEKLKVAHTKRGDLEKANAIVELIKTHKAGQVADNNVPAQIATLVGIWKRDTDGTLFEINSDGTGVWGSRDMFKVTHDPKQNEFEIKSPRWATIKFKLDNDTGILAGNSVGHNDFQKLKRVVGAR